MSNPIDSSKRTRYIPFQPQKAPPDPGLALTQDLGWKKMIETLDHKMFNLPYVASRTLYKRSADFDKRKFIKHLVFLFSKLSDPELTDDLESALSHLSLEKKKILLTRTLHAIKMRESFMMIVTYPLMCRLKKNDKSAWSFFKQRENSLKTEIQNQREEVIEQLKGLEEEI